MMAGYTNFEFSWEVANKVGGIYQVIKSKVPVSIDELGYDNYVLIGPKFSDKVVHTEVEPAELRDPVMQARRVVVATRPPMAFLLALLFINFFGRVIQVPQCTQRYKMADSCPVWVFQVIYLV